MRSCSRQYFRLYGNQWWLGCVPEKDLENVQVKLSLLHPSALSQSF